MGTAFFVSFTNFWQRVNAYLRVYTRAELFFLFCFVCIMAGYFCFHATMQRNFIYAPALFLLIYVWQHKRESFWPKTRFLWGMMAAFWLYNLASVGWSQDFHPRQFLSFFRYELMAVAFTAGLAALLHKRPETWPFMVACYLVAACLTGLYAFGYSMVNIANHDFRFLRLQGTGRGVNSNICGALYAVAVLLIVYSKTLRDHPLTAALTHSRFRYPAVAFFLVIIGLTMGRGPAAALLFTFLFMTIAERNIRKLRCLLLAYGVLAFAIIANPADWGAIISRGDDNRFDIWRQAMQYIQGKIMTGTGIATDLVFTIPSQNLTFQSTHNILLGALVYGGLIGLALCAGFLLTLFYNGWRLFRMGGEPAVLALIVYGGVFFMFEGHTLIVNLNPEWLFTFLPAALCTAFLPGVSATQQRISVTDTPHRT